jgi:hypothetical protein
MNRATGRDSAPSHPVRPRGWGGIVGTAQHFRFFDSAVVWTHSEGRTIKSVDHLLEHCVGPVVVEGEIFGPARAAFFTRTLGGSASWWWFLGGRFQRPSGVNELA